MDPLRQWVVKHGARVHDNISARAIPSMGGGMGIVALAPLAPNTLLVSIPAKLMLTTKRAKVIAKSALGSSRAEIREAVDALSPVQAIAMALLCIRHRERMGLTAEDVSFFAPWIDALPTQYDNLLELPPGAVSECMASLPRYKKKIEEEIAAWGAMHETLRPLLHPTTSSPCEFLWAYNSLMSRGFAFDEDIWTMMPWVDYFNYDRRPNATMTYNKFSRTYDFRVAQLAGIVAEGDQLCLKYGDYSDFELALWYGFTLSDHLPPDAAAAAAVVGGGGGSGSSTAAAHDRDVLISYCFSPLADANGMKPWMRDGAQLSSANAWLDELLVRADLVAPPSLCPASSAGGRRARRADPLDEVRVCSRGVSSALGDVLQEVAAANSITAGAALQRIAAAELGPSAPAPQDAAGERGADFGSAASRRFAEYTAATCTALLRRLAFDASPDELEAIASNSGVCDCH